MRERKTATQQIIYIFSAVDSRYENFIVDALVYAANSTSNRLQIDAMHDALSSLAEVDVESIESLLRARIVAFAKAPVCLLIFFMSKAAISKL